MKAGFGGEGAGTGGLLKWRGELSREHHLVLSGAVAGRVDLVEAVREMNHDLHPAIRNHRLLSQPVAAKPPEGADPAVQRRRWWRFLIVHGIRGR